MVMILPEILKCSYGNGAEENMITLNERGSKDSNDEESRDSVKITKGEVTMEGEAVNQDKTITDAEVITSAGDACASEINSTSTDGIQISASNLITKQPRISAKLTQLQHLGLNHEARREQNKRFVLALEDSEGKQNAFVALKRKISQKTAQKIVDDFNHSNSCMDNVCDAVKDIKNTLKNHFKGINCACTCAIPCCGHCEEETRCQLCGQGPNWEVSNLKVIQIIATNYYDLVKDLTVVASMIFVLDSSFLDTEFFNGIIWTLLSSLVIPLLVSAIETALKHPAVVLHYKTFMALKQNPPLSLKAAVFCGYIFVPAVILVNIEKAEMRRRQLLESGKKRFQNLEELQNATDEETLKQLEMIECYLESLYKARLVFYKNEASMEIPVQLTMQLMMLLMTQTKTPTYYTREAFFAVNDFSIIESWNLNKTFLLTIIVLSFMKNCTTYVKIVKSKKSGFLPIAAQLLLGFRAFVVSSTRVLCYIAFFGPFLGLLNSLQHLKAEQMDWDPDLFEKLTGVNSFWDQDISAEMFRKPKPDYTAYTVLTLKKATFVFVAIIGVYSIVIAITKYLVDDRFRRAHLLKKIKYVLDGINMPDASKDWDEDDKEENSSFEDYHKKRSQVLRATITLMALHLISNLVFIVPTLVTGGKSGHITIIYFLQE